MNGMGWQYETSEETSKVFSFERASDRIMAVKTHLRSEAMNVVVAYFHQAGCSADKIGNLWMNLGEFMSTNSEHEIMQLGAHIFQISVMNRHVGQKHGGAVIAMASMSVKGKKFLSMVLSWRTRTLKRKTTILSSFAS